MVFGDSRWFCKDVLQIYCISTGFVWILVRHVHPRPPPPSPNPQPRKPGNTLDFWIRLHDVLICWILIGFLDSLWFCKDVLQNYSIFRGFVWILVKHVHPRPPPPPPTPQPRKPRRNLDFWIRLLDFWILLDSDYCFWISIGFVKIFSRSIVFPQVSFGFSSDTCILVVLLPLQILSPENLEKRWIL